MAIVFDAPSVMSLIPIGQPNRVPTPLMLEGSFVFPPPPSQPFGQFVIANWLKTQVAVAEGTADEPI